MDNIVNHPYMELKILVQHLDRQNKLLQEENQHLKDKVNELKKMIRHQKRFQKKG